MSLPENWSAMKKLKHSLLRRAFDENRGAEVILLIQWRLAHERYKNEGGVKALRAFEADNKSQPRAIRALNLIAAEKGLKEIYKEKVDLLRAIHKTPEDQKIIMEPVLRQTMANTVHCFGLVQPEWMFEKPSNEDARIIPGEVPVSLKEGEIIPDEVFIPGEVTSSLNEEELDAVMALAKPETSPKLFLH